MKTGLLFDERFLDHDAGQGHPERRERLESSIEHLRGLPWFERLAPIAPRKASPDDIGRVHSPDLIQRARSSCSEGRRFLDVPDVGISENSFDIALLAAGAALTLVDAVVDKTLDNGFGLLRPPGHHAEFDMALGFCLFNNVAIAARHLQRTHGLERVLILDWDVHHGNGTQHVFEDDGSVLYVSLHQYPFYPGTGAASEVGTGAGRGATLNCPMMAGATDADYEAAFRKRVLPHIDDFRPDAVLISAGFDAHADDPLGGTQLSTEFFGWMTERMMEVADHHAQGRLVSLLEGGYNLTALPRCIAEHLRVLSRQA